jgi:hypothetical protein
MELKREPRSGIKVMSAFGPKRTFVSIAVKQLVTPHPDDVLARRALKDFEHSGIQSVV